MNAPAASALPLIPEATRLLIRDRDARLWRCRYRPGTLAVADVRVSAHHAADIFAYHPECRPLSN
jgi:hypothetical protein